MRVRRRPVPLASRREGGSRRHTRTAIDATRAGAELSSADEAKRSIHWNCGAPRHRARRLWQVMLPAMRSLPCVEPGPNPATSVVCVHFSFASDEAFPTKEVGVEIAGYDGCDPTSCCCLVAFQLPGLICYGAGSGVLGAVYMCERAFLYWLSSVVYLRSNGDFTTHRQLLEAQIQARHWPTECVDEACLPFA